MPPIRVTTPSGFTTTPAGFVVIPATDQRPERVMLAFSAAQIMALVANFDMADELPDAALEDALCATVMELTAAFKGLTGRSL